MMKIYGDAQSGNCLKVKYTANYLGLSYQWEHVDILAGQTREPAFLKLNPQGQIPLVVFDDGRILSQSNAILLYLAQGSALVPDDLFTQAKVNQWLFWEQYSHEPYIAVCRFHMHYLKKSKETREKWRVERGEAALDTLENQFGQTPWLSGEHFTVADVALFAYTHVAEEGGFDIKARPRLARWIDNCRSKLKLS